MTVGLRCLLLGVVLTSRATQAQSNQSSPRIAAQVALGTVLTPVGFIGSGWAAKHLARRAGAEDPSRVAFVSAYTGAWLAAASGPLLVGRDGKVGPTLAGSAVGLGSAVLLSRLGNVIWDDDRRSCGLTCWLAGALTIALPSIGATAGYAISR